MDVSDMVVKKRIYVGNLPFDTTEDDIRSKFKHFGDVLKVELKHRTDSSFDTGLPCYAFLDLKIKENAVETCFKKISKKKWGGNIVKLELARESLLSRLEKERAVNNENANSSKILATSFNAEVKSVPSKPLKKDCQLSPRNKSHGSSSLQDKIGFVNNSGKTSVDLPTELSKTSESLSVTKTNSMKANSVVREKKKGTSEKIRLQTIEERQKFFLHQKDAIKLALSAVDKVGINNRIVFDEDQDTEVGDSSELKNSSNSRDTSRSKPSLFNDDADDDDITENIQFHIKKQFEGKKGQKLLELQSNYANDQRFSLDERFYESEDEEQKNEENDDELSPHEELKRQMEILDSIVGTSLPKRTETKDSRSRKPDNFMLRFDPAIAEHEKYEIKIVDTPNKEPPQKKIKLRNKSETGKRRDLKQQTAPVVSKEKFYKVAESLKETLKSNENTSFSLLDMFGTSTEKSDDHEETNQVSKVHLARDIQDWSANPFKYDSSESEDDDEAEQKPEPAQAHQPAVWRESFFFKTDDSRLSEGLEFFSVKSASEEDFDQKRRELRQIVVAKVRHNLRKSQLLEKKLGGQKLNKNFGNKKKFNK